MKKRPDPLDIPDGFLEKKMSVPSFRNPIEQIYDEKDTSNIILYNEKDEPIEFIQIAFIPYKKKDYVILRPVLPWEGLKEDEAIVFEIKKGRGRRDKKDDQLRVVEDSDVIDEIFVLYNDLMDEIEKKK